MSKQIRRRLFAAAGLMAGLGAQPARADGDIEKPPSVPPEVCAAKTACPTLTGPCYGYYATKWRVLPGCCVAPAPAVAAPERPTRIPPAYGLRTAARTPPVSGATAAGPTQAAGGDPAAVRPTAARIVVIPPAPRPEPPAAPDIEIPPPPVSTVGTEPNRPMLAEVLRDSSKLRK
jgi:hypothetical protein